MGYIRKWINKKLKKKKQKESWCFLLKMKINFKKTVSNITFLKKEILDTVEYHIFLKRFVVDLLYAAFDISVKYLLTKLNP